MLLSIIIVAFINEQNSKLDFLFHICVIFYYIYSDFNIQILVN